MNLSMKHNNFFRFPFLHQIFISFFFLSFTENLNLVDVGDTASVILLNSGNFEQSVVQSKDVWFVLFRAPGCPYVKQLKREWDKASKALEGNVKFGELDCDVENDIQARFGVTRFPTIFAFGPDSQLFFAFGPNKCACTAPTGDAPEKAGLSYHDKAQRCKMEF
ncbi:hypothetical protein Lser_V15G45621 [Lactuca serriola]